MSSLQLNTVSAAVSISNLTSGVQLTATSATSASITPTANNLVLVTVVSRTSSGDPNHPTLTGNSLTYVEIASANYDNTGTQKRVTLFRAMGSSPTSGTIAIDFAGQTQTDIKWSVDQASGTDTSGTNGSGAIVQSATNADTSNLATALTVTLAAFSSTNNATYGGFGKGGSGGHTVGSGFTQLSNETSAGAITVSTQWRVDNDTTVDVTSSEAGEQGGIAIEIKAATAGVTDGKPLVIFND